MTSPRDFPQLSSINEVLSIEHLSTISQYFESRDVARDIARDSFVHAEHPSSQTSICH